MSRLNLTSLFTFTDDPAGSLRYDTAFEPVEDDTYIYNHIEVNAPDGTRGLTGSGVAIDAASTTDYGVIVHSVESETSDGGTRQALADYLAYWHAQPRERLPEFTPIGNINPAAAWPAILSLEIGVPITVVWRDGLSGTKTLDALVEGMTVGGNPQLPFYARARTAPRDTATYMVTDDAVLGLTDAGNRAGI